MAYANLSQLTQKQIGQKLNLEAGVSQEKAEFYALGGGTGVDTVNDLGYLFDLKITGSDSGANVFQVTVEMLEGQKSNVADPAAPTEEHRMWVEVLSCDTYDSSASQAVRYTLAATAACTAVDATKAAGYQLDAPHRPRILLESANGAVGGGYGKFVFTITRTRTDGSTGQAGTGNVLLVFKPEQMHWITTFTHRLLVTDFD